MPMPQIGTFEALTPDRLIDAVETALNRPMTGLANPQTSYINRVYELQARDGTRLIAKFYRPGRWTPEALRAEHRFVSDCAAAEIPVIAPLPLADGDTLACVDGIRFCVYPKRWGRGLEIVDDEGWLRLGRLLARVHLAGQQRPAPERLRLHPDITTRTQVAELLDGLVSPRWGDEFRRVTDELLAVITPLFTDVAVCRIHGDCHQANLLDRPGEGLMIIDFDDMMVGPPVQDIWMLLPGRAREARRELNLLLEGYEEFREFPWPTIRLIEPLRAMRIIYFLAWVGRQLDDPAFRDNFPDWGGDAFWSRQVRDLGEELRQIQAEL